MLSEDEPTLHETRHPRGRRFELRLKGKMISRTSVVDVRMRLGTATLKVGGIGGVWTDEKHRGRGHMRRLMNHALEWMAARSYDLSALYGIPDFYWRFGYAPCMLHEMVFTVPADAQVEHDKSLKVRQLRKGEEKDILRLYRAATKRQDGAVVRPGDWRYFRHGTRWHKKPLACVATDSRGRIAGYAAYEFKDDAVVPSEAIARTPDACRALLAKLLAKARRRKLESVKLHISPDCLMAGVCRAVGCEVYTRFRTHGGGMGRVIRQRQMLGKLELELTRRLERSRFARFNGAIEIKTDLGTDVLLIRRGTVKLAGGSSRRENTIRLRLSQQALTQLVLGWRRADELLPAEGNKLSKRKTEILNALFPARWTYTWWPDRW
jgi:predicted acetyltransferase